MGPTPEMLAKYPSLQKFVDLGDAYQEWNDGREAKLLDFIYAHPSLESMRGNPAKIVEAMDEFAAQHDFLINIGPNKGQLVTKLIDEEKPRVLVELGGYVGYSAILFGDQMRRSRPEEAARGELRLWSLEFSPLFASIAMNVVELAGLSGVVKVVVGTAEASLRRLTADGTLGRGVDVLFLDHVEDLYDQDLRVTQSLGLLRPGACVVADNVLRPGAPKYREYVRAHPGLTTTVMEGLIVPGEFKDEIDVSKVK